MDPITASSLACCVAVYLLSVAMPRSEARADAEAVALILLGSWATYTALFNTGSPPENMRLFPLVDLACGLLVLSRQFTRPEPYKAVLIVLLALQIAWHTLYWSARARWPEHIQLVYTVGLNVLGFAQIAIGSWPGAVDAARRIRAWVSRRSPGGHRLGAG